MRKPASILVIEDDPWFAEQYVRTLKSVGFTVRHEADGISGIAALDKSQPDVVILDIFLPGPNGLALLHEMKSYTDLSQLPIIVCTSSTSLITLDKLIPYGVTEVLDKGTMQPDDVVKAVRRALV